MGRTVSVVKCQKSGGVVTRDTRYRKESRTARVREYFYGPRNSLLPHSQTMQATNLLVFKVGRWGGRGMEDCEGAV